MNLLEYWYMSKVAEEEFEKEAMEKDAVVNTFKRLANAKKLRRLKREKTTNLLWKVPFSRKKLNKVKDKAYDMGMDIEDINPNKWGYTADLLTNGNPVVTAARRHLQDRGVRKRIGKAVDSQLSKDKRNVAIGGGAAAGGSAAYILNKKDKNKK